MRYLCTINSPGEIISKSFCEGWIELTRSLYSSFNDGGSARFEQKSFVVELCYKIKYNIRLVLMGEDLYY